MASQINRAHLYDCRAMVVCEDGQCAVDPDEEHEFRRNLDDYKAKLVVENDVLPDPFTLDSGWMDEGSKVCWPSVYFQDIVDLLRLSTASELYHRLLNEYKQGKAYRLVLYLLLLNTALKIWFMLGNVKNMILGTVVICGP
jgi:hypothetical protein